MQVGTRAMNQMKHMNRFFLATSAILATTAASGSPPVVIELYPDRDNTLIGSTDNDLSNGAGEHFFAGRTGNLGKPNLLRRGLLRFDVSEIPSDASIVFATLDLRVTKSPNNQSRAYEIHRCLHDWGEAGSSSSGGIGAPAQPGDATWFFTFFANESWTTPGGDFLPVASALFSVGGIGDYAVGTSGMAEDVQSWIDDPTGNFGWVMIGEEDSPQTVRRFGSRENPDAANRPKLTIAYDAGPPGIPGDFNGDGLVNGADVGLLLAAWGSCRGCPEDLDENGVVNGADLGLLLVYWTG